MNDEATPLLAVRDLDVRFTTPEGTVNAVNGIGFTLTAGETLGIVGESGSGKSQAALAIMGLLSRNGSARGSVRLAGKEILNLPPAKMNRIRGRRIAMIFQDPMTSLNPYLTIAQQMTEVLIHHEGRSHAEARRDAVRMLDAVQIPDAGSRIDTYAHEFSGGMRQRVMIAMALLCHPAVLIADEPTTALDVTVQAQILALMQEIERDFGTAILLITHDLGVVAGVCDRVLVMYAGQTVECGSRGDVFARPLHPYTDGLLHSVPRLDTSTTAPLATIPGQPPSLLGVPPGCPFAPRCSYRFAPCDDRPPLIEAAAGHFKACHLDGPP